MSALGHKRTLRSARAMSALPPKADFRARRVARSTGVRRIRIELLGYAACSTRLSISLRSITKSIGLVKSASAPPSSALRLVSASP